MATLQNGCHGFSKKFMYWQKDLILGGMAKGADGELKRYEAYHVIARRRLYNPAAVFPGR